MAQGIDENGGGEIHLIDISEEFLQDVFGKISQKGWKVTTHKHHIKINKETVNTLFSKKELLQAIISTQTC